MMQQLLSQSRRWQATLVFGAILNVITIGAIADVQPRGKQLAEIYCTRCHLLPDPHDLPKNVWPKSLADMGMYLGFEGDELPDILEVKPAEQRSPRSLRKMIIYTGGRELEISAYKNWIPATPMISVEDWIEVRNYFVDNAPLMDDLVLPQPNHPTLTGFEAVVPDLEVETNALVVSTRVDEVNDILYIGRSIGRQMDEIKEGTEDLLAIDIKSGKRLARKELATAPTFIELTDTGIRLTGHGEFPIVPGSGEAFITDLVFLNGDNVYANFVGGRLDKPKPYHGVTVLKNKGGRSFEQVYFYAMHSATRAAVADYDGDGDLDIAAISMYPDWRWDVPEAFVYLENVGDLQFQPASLSRDNFAIWLSIEAADVNGDDRPDIVLGLSDWPKFVPKDWTTREVMQGRGPDIPSIMYLLNRH